MTVFGKSQPDVSIYRSEGGYITGTTVAAATLSAGNNAIIRGGTIELKQYDVHHKNIESTEATQTVATMIRLAGFLSKKLWKRE